MIMGIDLVRSLEEACCSFSIIAVAPDGTLLATPDIPEAVSRTLAAIDEDVGTLEREVTDFNRSVVTFQATCLDFSLDVADQIHRALREKETDLTERVHRVAAVVRAHTS